MSAVPSEREALRDLVVAFGALYGFEGWQNGPVDGVLDRALMGLQFVTTFGENQSERALLGLHSHQPDDRYAHLLLLADPMSLPDRADRARAFGVSAARRLRLRKLYWEVPHRQPETVDALVKNGFAVEARMPARRYHDGTFWDVAILAYHAQDA